MDRSDAESPVVAAGLAGRERLYTWHLTFEGQADVHRLVRAYQARLDLPGLDPVPLEWLHLTMQGVGFTDEISEPDLRQIVAAASARCAVLKPCTCRSWSATAMCTGG